MHWTILLKSHPEAQGNPVLQGLRLAAAALADGVEISIFLSEQAMALAFQEDSPTEKQHAHHDLLHEIHEMGARIHVVGMEWLHQSEQRLLNPCVEVASMKTLVRQMKNSDQVITL